MTDPALLKFGAFDLDARRLTLHREGELAHMAALPCRVLAYLAARPGELVSREELRDRIWGRTVLGFDDRLNTCMATIRSNLGDDAAHPQYIETCRGRGYRFVGQVTAVAGRAPGVAASERRVWRRSVILGLAASLAALFVAMGGSGGSRADLVPVASATESDLLTPRTTESEAAWDLYLQADAALRRKTIPARLEAAGYLERALEIDDRFALAQAKLAVVRSLLAWIQRGEEASVLADAAVRRAEEIAPDLPETIMARGLHRYLTVRDFEGSLALLRRAEEARPNDPELLTALGRVLLRMGRWEEGIEALERSLALDPHSVATLSTLGSASGRLRDFEAADRYFRLALAIDPSLSDVHMRRATLFLKWGKGVAGARAALEAGYARGAGTPTMLAFRHRQLARVVGDWALEWQVRQRLVGGSGLTDEELEQWKRDEADRLMKYAIEVGRDDPPAGAQIARNLGVWYASRDMHPEAAAANRHAVVQFEYRLHHADIGWEGVPYEQLFLAAAYAGEGRIEEARRQAHAVLGAFPEERDALTSAYLRVSIAEILTSIGDHDEAIAILRYELGRPSPVTPALLDVDPVWRPLDGRPEFESLRALSRWRSDTGAS